MIRCPACSAEGDDASRYCAACGEALSSPSQAPTAYQQVEAPAPDPASPPPSLRSTPGGGLASSDAIDLGALAPGTVIAGRYRMIGMIGRGGMGEVYRADDLKLGQAVALKFLPAVFASDAARRERFFAEVRLSRRVAHPSVCRVYDVAELDGRHFLTMEYVDGEDLASLLRRIDRLPHDKALQISRQLCSGLTAAHDLEVLHRDLKPANIMLDGRGRVRITDFGLAIAAGESERDARGGTPEYMAPEQLAGQRASVRSDIYSLGLVLYELWTGRRAFRGPGLTELIEQKQALPQPPSELAPQMDPVVERVILQCLDPDPALRPASALQVAAALPGGDPLAAALAAGETPSPEMVAAASTGGALSVRAGGLALAAALGLLAVFAWTPGPDRMIQRVHLTRGPGFLGGVAADLIARVGVPCGTASSAYGFWRDRALIDGLLANDASPDRWARLERERPGPTYFWYRTSPELLVPDQSPRVWEDDPSFDVPGMCAVRLDPHGQLLSFRHQPVALPTVSGPEDWAPFFAAAGLDLGAARPVAPTSIPKAYADSTLAWVLDGGVGLAPLRVEAASLGRQAVRFDVERAWPALPPAPTGEASTINVAEVSYAAVVLFAWVGGAVLARRNWRRRMGDRKGAFRVATVYLVTALLVWLLRASHVPSITEEWYFAQRGMAHALFWAATLWLVYLALEPSVRRRWPELLVSWNRALAGRVRDPLVGRDLLLGSAFGIAMTEVVKLEYVLAPLVGVAPPPPSPVGLGEVSSVLDTASGLLGSLLTAQRECLGVLVALLLLRLVLRWRWAAELALVLMLSFVVQIWDQPFWLYWPLALARAAAWVAVMSRGGVLRFAAGTFAWYSLMLPIDVSPSAFYFGQSLVTLAVVAAVPIAGFVLATRGPATTAPRPTSRGDTAAEL